MVNIDRLEGILKKCSNVKGIDSLNVLVNDRVLDVITDCCQRLIEMNFDVNDLTKEAIIRFGNKLGHKLKKIRIYDKDSSVENQQILFNLCTDIESLKCRHFLSLNVIASKHLKRLKLIHSHLWSDNDIQAFGRFVDTNDNNLIHLKITTDIDIYHHLDDILRSVCRMTNIKIFRFIDIGGEPIDIQTQGLRDLVPVCKRLKKVSLCVNINNFDLWQIFSHFNALKELTIDKLFGFGSLLIDTKTRIKPLPTLKKLIIECESIGNYFFCDITQFGPNLEVLTLSVCSPRYQFSNQHLIALSECKRMKKLWIEFELNVLENVINPQEVDDIGLITLIENCKHLKRIEFGFRVDSIIKFIEVISDTTKRSITFESFFLSEHFKTVFSNMSRLENVKCLKLTDNKSLLMPWDCDLIRVMFDKSMTISAIITAETYFIERTDVWQTLYRYKDLERLEFRFRYEDFDKSMSNIKPLIKLKEIIFICKTVNKHFFDNITKLAPNVEEFELISLFNLTNDNLITLSKLICLTRIKLVSTEEKEHSVDDIGVVLLLDNCPKLREVVLDLELYITCVLIEKLKEMANQITTSILNQH